MIELMILLCLQQPDTVLLTNGDRITGTVVERTPERVVVRTAYAGEIELDGSFVEGLLSEQEAPPAVAAEEEEMAWKGFVEGGGSIKSGNSDIREGHVAFLFDHETEDHRWVSRGRFDFKSVDDSVVTRKAYGSSKYDFRFDDDFYVYAAVEAGVDELADLQLRLVPGAGVGYDLIHDEEARVFIEGGPAYLIERYKLGDDNDRGVARASLGIHWEFMEDVAFDSYGVLFRGVTSPDLRMRNEAGITVSLTERWGFKVGHIFDYNSDPARTIDRVDTILFGSIVYRFGE